MTTKPRRKAKVAAPILSSHIPDKPKVEGEPHKVGYARVSMSDQSNQRQVDALVEYGVAAVDIFSDTGSGKNMDRAGWRACWRDLREGDILVVQSLERLGRNLEELLKIERELREKGVALKALAQDINTSTAGGRLIFHILATMAQFEREWSLERTMHGLKLARERGVVGGALPTWTDEQVTNAVAKFGGPLGDGAWRLAAKDLGCSKVTVMRRWKNIEAKKRKEALG